MVAFIEAKAAKAAVLSHTASDFFDTFLLTPPSTHFNDDKLQFVAECLSEEYQTEISKAELVVVGSSKLGFALHDKVRDGQVIAPAFRAYDRYSDIDLSICSPALFSLLWHEISAYLCKQKYIPVRYKKLGDLT